MADFNATSEQIRGQVQANQTRQQLMAALATQSARYAGRGLALEGTPDLVAEQTIQQANRELTMQSTNSTIRAEQQRQRAQLLNSEADYTATGGAIGAGVNLFQTVNNRLNNTPGTVRTPGSYTGGDGSYSGGSWP
jgi:phage protein D